MDRRIIKFGYLYGYATYDLCASLEIKNKISVHHEDKQYLKELFIMNILELNKICEIMTDDLFYDKEAVFLGFWGYCRMEKMINVE